MPRRIDVELTSARDDGSWTWRAAGAREPRGVLAGDLLYPGAKVGDVVKAEADFDIEGITITSIAPPRAKAAPANVIPVTGAPRDFEPVTTSLAPRREGGPRRDRGFEGDRDRRPRPPGADRGPRPGGAERTGRTGRPGDERTGRPGDERRQRVGADRDRGAPAGPRPGRERAEPAASGERPSRPAPRPEPAARPRPKRLSPASRHRAAVLGSLSPEQRPVAEQVLRGGLPAVRRAIEEQNAQARAEGLPEVRADALVAMAEDLLPRLKTAEWHDRADAALADVDQIGLRDLRSVVSGADAAARDDETRALAVSLREALERRLKREQDDWIGEITAAVGDGRLVRALRVASRPPDAGMRIPAELAMRLAEAASEAMSADIQPDRWMALLEAVAASPVRTTVKPAGLPPEPGEAFLHAARQQAGRVPALAALLGITMPPPPGPLRRPPRPAPAPAGSRPRPIPPPPSRPLPAPGPSGPAAAPPRPPPSAAPPGGPAHGAQATAAAGPSPRDASAPATPSAQDAPADLTAPADAPAPAPAEPADLTAPADAPAPAPAEPAELTAPADAPAPAPAEPAELTAPADAPAPAPAPAEPAELTAPADAPAPAPAEPAEAPARAQAADAPAPADLTGSADATPTTPSPPPPSPDVSGTAPAPADGDEPASPGPR